MITYTDKVKLLTIEISKTNVGLTANPPYAKESIFHFRVVQSTDGEATFRLSGSEIKDFIETLKNILTDDLLGLHEIEGNPL